MADVVDADPVAVVIAYYLASEVLTEALGGAGRVSGLNEPPYPHIQVLDTPGGNDRSLEWLIAPELTIKVYGDFDGSPGKAELRRVFYLALQELRDLPKRPSVPGQPVVTAVDFSRGGSGWQPEPDGQPCYFARPQIYLHPPHS